MAGRVEGKIALVTGGANGMGRSHAMLLARRGRYAQLWNRQLADESAA